MINKSVSINKHIKKIQNSFQIFLLIALTSCTFLLLFAQSSVNAAPDRRLNYQGQLKDSSNNPITTPTTIRFSIYNHPINGLPTDTPSSSGPLLWSKIYNNTPCPQIVPKWWF